jgi:uncharacterized membrane protein YdjX (TVP38/TMEM64 family)
VASKGRGNRSALSRSRLWGTAVAVILLGVVVAAFWRALAGSPTAQLLVRLYADHHYLGTELQAWGVWAPLVFVAIQALQVVIAPIPGELTGLLGGFVFGQWAGFAYSMAGLTAGSLLAFGVGRWVGAAFVRRLVSAEVWRHLGFVIEAEGAILCFVIFLIPGFPKDMLCYLFGLSPMPFWVFAVSSTAGRMPGTWMLSAQGASTAAGHYVRVALVTAVAAALTLPLYVYRHQLVRRLHRSSGSGPGATA